MTSLRHRIAAVQQEAETTIAGLVAAAIAAVVAVIAFWGSIAPLWRSGDWSIGAIAAIVSGVLGLITAFVMYWRSRNQPGQEWRLRIPSWKFILDAIAVAFVHAATASVLVVGLFAVFQRSFIGLDVDAFAAVLAVAITAGLACYWIAASCAAITTQRMSVLLVVYMTISVFAAMLTTTEPQWWEYHFSQLGSFGNGSASLFNITLVAAGALVVVFSMYLGRDLSTLHRAGILVRAFSAKYVAVLFVIMGFMLAGVGLVSVSIFEPLHVAFASGMFTVFIGMLIASPWLFAGMPRSLQLTTWAFLAAVVTAVVLFFPVGYLNLTALELVAFALIFGWITVFIRFEAATIAEISAMGAVADSREAMRLKVG